MFQKNMLLSFSGLKNKASKKPAASKLAAHFMLGLFFDTEDGCYMIL
jgi:hypothetical protein